MTWVWRGWSSSFRQSGEGYEEFSSTPHAKEDFYSDGEGLVAVVSVRVSGAAACLGFESVSAEPLVSSSFSERKSLSAREGGTNKSVPIVTATSCKCKRKR